MEKGLSAKYYFIIYIYLEIIFMIRCFLRKNKLCKRKLLKILNLFYLLFFLLSFKQVVNMKKLENAGILR